MFNVGWSDVTARSSAESRATPPVVFFLPQTRCEDPLDRLVDIVRDPARVGDRFANETSFAWTLQTYVRLKAAGVTCEIADVMPEHGIVIVARCDLPFDTVPRPGQLIVCTVADATPHPYAQVQIVQNQVQCVGPAGVHHVPHWPQPGLEARDTSRGSRLENVAYFGHQDQLADELKQPRWREFLATLGLRWVPVFEDSNRKTDYRDVDLVIAVRGFGTEMYHHKPASKLFNAWHAGVPAILGRESAFRAERRSPLDYIEVVSYEQLEAAVTAVASAPDRRQAIMHHGSERATETTVERIVEQWSRLITDHLIPEHQRWCSRGRAGRMLYLCGRHLRVRQHGLRQRVAAVF